MAKETRVVVLLKPEQKKEVEKVARELSLPVSAMFRLLYEKPSVYGRLVEEAKKKLKGGEE